MDKDTIIKFLKRLNVYTIVVLVRNIFRNIIEIPYFLKFYFLKNIEYSDCTKYNKNLIIFATAASGKSTFLLNLTCNGYILSESEFLNCFIKQKQYNLQSFQSNDVQLRDYGDFLIDSVTNCKERIAILSPFMKGFFPNNISNNENLSFVVVLPNKNTVFRNYISRRYFNNKQYRDKKNLFQLIIATEDFSINDIIKQRSDLYIFAKRNKIPIVHKFEQVFKK
jgi:hypothetical protein